MLIKLSTFANAIMNLRDSQAEKFKANRATNSLSRPFFLHDVDSLNLQNPVVLYVYVPFALTYSPSSFSL